MAGIEPVKRKVLICVDWSPWAELAFDFYVKNIHQSDNEVICFHSGETPQIGLTTAGDAYSLALDGCRDAAKRVEDKFVQKLQEACIAGRVVVRFSNNTGEDIVEMSKSEAVTMTVIGTRGLGTARRTILGSVSDYVMHHSHCPVVVCCHERARRRSSSIREDDQPEGSSRQRRSSSIKEPSQ